MFSGFQSNAFQSSGFQIVRAAVTTTPERVVPGGTVYHAPYHKYKQEEDKRLEVIRRDKSELEKLQSVLAENERKKALAAESALLASKKQQARLAKLEQEYNDEITRLLAVRAEIMARIKREEEIVIMAMFSRRRLRAFTGRADLGLQH